MPSVARGRIANFEKFECCCRKAFSLNHSTICSYSLGIRECSTGLRLKRVLYLTIVVGSGFGERNANVTFPKSFAQRHDDCQRTKESWYADEKTDRRLHFLLKT